jgi:UDP-N-acetylmuramate--alanine ligase
MRYHFSGIGGQGMNPLAQLMCAWGHQVQGSDRAFDQGKSTELASKLRSQGIVLKPQDGSAIVTGIDRFVFSAAVEQDTPEVRAAKSLGIQLVPRPGLLAEVVNAGKPGIAIAGTSGKSTVVGMLAWILRHAGRPATILGGAALAGDGIVAGCFAAGPADGPVVAEACESDGTLVGYRPTIGLIHNLTRDHAEVEELHKQFDVFARQSATLFVNSADPEALKAAAGHPRVKTYGTGTQADLPLEIITVGPRRAQGVISLPQGDLLIELPLPGAHNLDNACAATAVALELGIAPAAIRAALATFPGVARRFEEVGVTEGNIRVIDDFAHNAEKIKATILAAQAGCDRLIAIFQPHGYGPARFLRNELREMLPTVLRPQDRFCYTEIYYAGGSVTKDISSRDLAEDLPSGLHCAYAANHQELLIWVSETAIPGDTVLLMGARDPELPRLAQAIFDLL